MPSIQRVSLLATALSLTSTINAAALPEVSPNFAYIARRTLKTGLGTKYGDGCTEEDCWQQGACSFVDYDLPAGIDGSTCVSNEIWDNGANCGGCIKVTYKGKTLTIMVTNRTGGDATHLDMTPDTWNKLTNNNPGGGVDGIQWDWVTCPLKSSPLIIKMHGGASKYWPAATVENATLRTSKLEFSADEGKTWKSTSRSSANIFIMDGTLSVDVAWVRVTSVDGKTLIVKDVALKSEQRTEATGNYA